MFHSRVGSQELTVEDEVMCLGRRELLGVEGKNPELVFEKQLPRESRKHQLLKKPMLKGLNEPG